MSVSALTGPAAGTEGSACWHCCRREECPYSWERIWGRALERAAAQGQTAARCLTAEAGQRLEAICRADDICRLLQADQALEHTLNQLLSEEIACIGRFSGGKC